MPASPRNEVIMATVPFFRELKASSRAELASICTIRSLPKKNTLFLEGEAGHAFYLLVRGRIQLYKTTPDGRETVIRVIKPGEVFAEVILYERDSYPVTAVALQDSEVMALPRAGIRRLLAEESFRQDFIVMLLHKQRFLTEQIQRLAALDVEARFFLFLRDQYGEREDMQIPLSKKDVAAAIGTTPESLSRLILRLKKQKRLSWTGHTLRLAPGTWKNG
ncbi:MAG: Crp/Fnr family transcriptional regulator [Kiritimatiellae bacterium]|nr:Crp/Fnr family transcriptional regulator [Kiritimatiellia bacterium]MDD4737489.1 Crp/Fnr family transcriptional regulator [Kiritimatiellia bacterium]